MRPLRIASWNVNGLRSCTTRGCFLPWLGSSGASIVGVQEVRARPEQLDRSLVKPGRWSTHFVAAERAGYSGVGLFSRRRPDRVDTQLGDPRFDVEGRLQLAHFGPLVVANVYFPNGKGKDRDNSRVPFKLEFYRRLHDELAALRAAGRRVLVLGDFNTAHTELDLARPRQNRELSGFLPEERDELSRWLAAGWVDTFRRFNPGPGHYSWWSPQAAARDRNIGWRLDYILACPAAAPYLRSAAIHPDVTGSDHCPVSVTLDPQILLATAQPAAASPTAAVAPPAPPLPPRPHAAA